MHLVLKGGCPPLMKPCKDYPVFPRINQDIIITFHSENQTKKITFNTRLVGGARTPGAGGSGARSLSTTKNGREQRNGLLQLILVLVRRGV